MNPSVAGLAAVTTKIKLFASTAILTLPPALCARMAVTIDSIAPGRFGMPITSLTSISSAYFISGVNIVTGWQPAEYEQMSIWPSNEYFGYRYDYAQEYGGVLSKPKCLLESFQKAIALSQWHTCIVASEAGQPWRVSL
jgi:pyrimidine oxygenase